MNTPRTSVPALLLSVALLASACGSDNSEAADVAPTTTAAAAVVDNPTPSSEPTKSDDAPESLAETGEGSTAAPAELTDPIGDLNLDVPPDIKTTITKVAQAAKDTEGKWAGFVPNDHPAVIAVKDADGNVAEAIAINFPKADELGDAQKLSTDGTPFNSLHRVTSLSVTDTLAGIGNFDFHLQLAGVDTFAITSDPSDGLLNGVTDEFAATYIHEMFHRYQDEAFTASSAGQDVDGYDYSPENIQMAALEERAIFAAHTANSAEAKRAAAEHVVALRETRLERDGRVVLDNSQERFEGTARWIEHLISRPDGDTLFKTDNLEVGVRKDIEVENGVKDWYGFGRFYGTGAAILGLASDLGATNIAEEIESGKSPIEVLASAVKVDESNRASLVESAKETYDAAGELLETAEKASEAAPTEGDIFENSGGGDSDAPEGDAGSEVPDGEGQEITAEEIKCLSDNGFDIESGHVISDELWETCFTDAA